MKKNLYYQVDICDDGTATVDGGTYCKAEVLVFEFDDIEAACSPDPVLTIGFQSHPVRDSNEKGKLPAYIPAYVRHNNMPVSDAYVPWYSGRFKAVSTHLWCAVGQIHRASLVMGRIERAVRAWGEENADRREDDELRQLTVALRRLKARPVKYADFKYKVVA